MAISIFDLMTLNMCSRCLRLWDNFHQVGPSTTYPCLNYNVFWCWYVISRCDPLTLKVRGTSSVTWLNLSEIEQSPAELVIILRIFAHVMLRRDLDLWPLDLELLQHFGRHTFKLCTTSEQHRIIHGCGSYDLARFRMQF